ncbi:hypothetical protein DTB58_00325, partial [Streptomyces griseus]|nr:hypothetical protein [Streptomyces griseus]
HRRQRQMCIRAGPPAGLEAPRPATRCDIGRVLATGEAYARPAHHNVGGKTRRTGWQATSGISTLSACDTRRRRNSPPREPWSRWRSSSPHQCC